MVTIEVIACFLGATYFLGAASAVGLFSMFLGRVYVSADGSSPRCFFRAVWLSCLTISLILFAQGLMQLNLP